MRHGTEEDYFKKEKPTIILTEIREEIISFFKNDERVEKEK